MATRINPSQLDFEQIKAALKQYYKDSGEFNDYNFEGSGLSAIVDVLAYDTHMKALTANFALNEAFLDSAQLRGSVVSHAKSLNYLPGSRNSSTAVLNVAIAGADPLITYNLPKYSLFSSTIDNVAYTFYTLDEYDTNQAAGFIFSNVNVYEGRLLTKRFIVDADTSANPIYVIPDDKMYVGSLDVQVRDGLGSESITRYRRASRVEDFASDQNVYFISEAANGYYELTFGDGLIGKAPGEGSVIEVKYLQSNAATPNGAATFSTSDTIAGLTLTPSIVQVAAGGAEKETLESIRFNAPMSYASQDRAVTESDFTALIKNAVTYVESLNVYGGEKADPPEFGKVFISVKPFGVDAMTDAQKSQLLTNTLNDRVILSVTPVLVDPIIQYLEVTSNFVYDDAKTPLTEQTLESNVAGVIETYGEENLLGFQSPFRRSVLTSTIDASNDSILSSDVVVRLQGRVKPTAAQLGVNTRYDVEFTNKFAEPSSATYIVDSDPFIYSVDGVAYTCFLRNKTGTKQLEIYRRSAAGESIIVIDDAGTIDYTRNVISLTPFAPSQVQDSDIGIRISILPASQNKINPIRNILLRLDTTKTRVTAEKDG